MRTSQRRVAVSLLLFGLILSAGPLLAQERANLFVNGGFEQDDGKGGPAGWGIYPFAGAPGGGVRLETRAFRGQRALSITEELTPALYGIFSQPIRVDDLGTEELLLTGYFRTEQDPVTQVALVGFAEPFLQQEWATPFLQSECQTLPASKDWSLFSWRFRLIPGVRELVAIFRLRAGGKLWLDEVSLQPYPAEVACRVLRAGTVAAAPDRRVVEVEVTNRGSREKTVQVLALALAERRRPQQVTSDVRLGGGQTRQVRLEYRHDCREPHLLRVIVQEPGGVPVYEQRDLQAPGLISARVAAPAFRQALIEGVPTPRIAVTGQMNVTPDQRSSLRVTGQLLGARDSEMQAVRTEGDRFRLEIPPPSLVSGDHVVRVTARLGNVEQVVDLPLRRLVPAPGQVSYDEQHRLWLSGRPLFPRGIYGIENTLDLQRAAQAGFNLVVVPSARASQELQDEARKLGVAVVIAAQSIDESFWQHQERKWGTSAITLGWLPYSRPDVRNIPPDEIARLYSLLREVSPAHPVISILGSPSLARHYAASADIVLAWSSPVPDSPLRAVGDMVQVLREATEGRRPVWAIVQASGNGHYVDPVLGPEKVGRDPTPAEMEALAFLALAHGADGLMWYAYRIGAIVGVPGFDLRRDAPALWEALPGLHHRLSWLTPVLTEGERELLPPAAEGRITMARWRHQGATYVLAINTSDRGLVTPLPGFTPGASLEVMFENRALRADSDGEVQDSLPPHGVRVYVTG